MQPALRDKPAKTAGLALDVEDLSVRYGATLAVDGVSLPIEPGEVVALLGPSGCGKTTLLRVVAGFVRQAKGRVRVDGAPIDHLPANQRNVGIVFQNYALFPHMTVAENVAYGLRARGVRGPETAAQGQPLPRDRCSSAASAIACRASSRAASSSAWRSPARSRSSRRSCCSTSRSPRSTATSGSTCRSRSSACSARSASPPSW